MPKSPAFPGCGAAQRPKSGSQTLPFPTFLPPLPFPSPRGFNGGFSNLQKKPTGEPPVATLEKSAMNGKKVNVAMVGLGFGAEFIPIYQRHPECQHLRHLPAERGEAEQSRRPVRHRQAVHEIRRRAERSGGRFRPHQLADSRSRLDVDGGPQGRQARDVYRADGDDDRRVRARSASSSKRPA